MADEENFRVDSVFHEDGARRYSEVKKLEGDKEKHQGRHREERKSKDYFATLAKRAEVSNQELAKKGLPYRFRILEGGGQVYIELVTLDKKGNVAKTVRRDISNEDFDRWMDDVSMLEGLFLDTNA
jgi:hypothetical protein